MVNLPAQRLISRRDVPLVAWAMIVVLGGRLAGYLSSAEFPPQIRPHVIHARTGGPIALPETAYPRAILGAAGVAKLVIRA